LAHDSAINFAAFSPDEQRIVTVSYDEKLAKVLNLKRQLLTTLTHNGYVNSAAFSPDGQHIVTASEDKTAKVWDKDGKLVATLAHEGVVNSAAFSSDGQRIVTASDDKTIKVWDKDRLLATLLQDLPVQSATFSPNGQQIVTIVGNRAKLLDKNGEFVATLDHKGGVNSIAFSPDGHMIVTASDDKAVKIWDNSGKLLFSLVHKAVVNSIMFSPNGQRIVTTSDKTAQVWDMSGKLLASLTHEDSVHSATFLPSGKIMTTSGKTTKVWENYFVEEYLESEHLPKLTLTQQLFNEVITLDEIGAQVGQLSTDELFGKIDKFYQEQVSNATHVENKKRYLQQLAVLIPVSSQNMGDMKSQIINLEKAASENTSQQKQEKPSESQESTLVNMETFLLVMFLALICVMVIWQLKGFFQRGRNKRGVVYGLIAVIVLGSGLVCIDNFYVLAPMFDQEAIQQIGEGLPSLGLILFSVMMLIVAAFFLFNARKRFFQQPVLRTLLLGFSLLMLVLPIGYLVLNYDILHLLSQVGTNKEVNREVYQVFAVIYGFILGSAIIVFLPIPLTAYALRPNRQNWWRWPARFFKAISMLLAYVLLLLVTYPLLLLLDGGLAFNTIPSELRWLLLLVAGLLLGQVIYEQFSVYRQQRKWFSLASFTLVYGFIFFALVWVLLGKGVWIDETFELGSDKFRRVIPYYEMADVLTLLVSLIALGFAIWGGRKTYQTQQYILSGVYWLASLFLVISIAIYIRPYGSMLPFLTLVLGSLLLLSYGVGSWLDNRRGWVAGSIVAVILAVVAWFVLINRAEKPPEAKPRPKVQQQDELSSLVMLTKKQAQKMAQRLVKEEKWKIFRDRLPDGSFGPEMIWIPAGQFRMGNVQGGDRDRDDEEPVHNVSIQRFAIGRNEVTVGEFRQFIKATKYQTQAETGDGCKVYKEGSWKKEKDANWRNPEFHQEDNQPVVCVSWNDAVAYVAWLSKETNKPYRLPSEAQWEYSARAGTETRYWWGNQIGVNWANCKNCGSQWDDKQTAPVGSFLPNPFGIYDTVGNLWEWVADSYHESYQGAPTDGSVWEGEGNRRVFRGGSFGNGPYVCRAAYRFGYSSDDRDDVLGFRVAVVPVAWTAK
jgi:formylglycine-generating enzyme required for sulfatase activity/uncharacterized protein with WD repeat